MAIISKAKHFYMYKLNDYKITQSHLSQIYFLYLELNKHPVEGFSAGLIDDNDLYRWEVLIIGPPDTL